MRSMFMAGPHRRSRSFLILSIAAAAVLATSQAASARPAYLYPGQSLSGGAALSTGQFRLVMQSDGNLVTYNQAGRALWASNTRCVCRAVMQHDGNLVIYRSMLPGGAVWSTRTHGRYGAYLILQDDGNLVVKQSGRAVWASGTIYSKLYAPDYLSRGHRLVSPNGRYSFVMQTDGNAVLYNHHTGRALWASRTVGRGHRLVMQRDGNLVVYPVIGAAVWSSRTFGRSGAYLNMQSDGNLVLYQGSRAVWATNTRG